MSTESVEKPAKGNRKATQQSITIQASKAWITWTRAAAEHCRTDVSKLVDAALVDYTKAKGFNIPPPPR